jgi:hypothetical protein
MLIGLVRPSWAGNENASAANAVAGEVANMQQMHRLFPDPTTNNQAGAISHSADAMRSASSTAC